MPNHLTQHYIELSTMTLRLLSSADKIQIDIEDHTRRNALTEMFNSDPRQLFKATRAKKPGTIIVQKVCPK